MVGFEIVCRKCGLTIPFFQNFMIGVSDVVERFVPVVMVVEKGMLQVHLVFLNIM